MYWFSGINNHNKRLYNDYIKMYKVAVITAKQTNPQLKPVLILDGEEDDNIRELSGMGVKIVKHRVKFYSILEKHYSTIKVFDSYKNLDPELIFDTIAFGAFIRIDIPHICKELSIEDDYVLYTDNDVMFISDVSELEKLKPNFYNCAGEFTKKFNYMGLNTGVMVVNWKNLLLIYDDFVDFISKNLNKFKVYDQDAIKLYFKEKIESLDYRYNYKPYWGPSNDVKILHFHGPKPTHSDEDLLKFPFKTLITPHFKEMTKKFNEVYDNYNLLNT